MKISDIAEVINETVKEPSKSGIDVFVGLEHYDIAEPVIKRFGSTQMLSTAAKVFKKGDVLIARRNVYLQRAAMAPFSGLTSGDSIVLRVKDDFDTKETDYETMSKLLPFILNSIDFWDYANTNADGTMSKRLSPALLLDYEFDLPSIEEQKLRAEKLWAAYEVKQSYLKMIKATQEMVQSQFIEMFGEAFTTNKSILLSEVVTEERPITYGVIKPGDFVDDGVILIRVKDLIGGKIALSNLFRIKDSVAQKYKRSMLSIGDILLSIRGTIGRTAIVPKELVGANITQDTARISLKESYNSNFIKCVLDSPIIQDWIKLHVKGLAVKGINLEDVRKIPIPIVEKDLQDKYIEIYHQADKSEFELRKSIDAIDAVIKSLINGIL